MIMMKKYFNFLMVCASFLALTVMVSCSEDDPSPIIDDDDPIPVADGMYLVGSATSTSAVVDFQMGDGVVGGPDFTTLERTGMFSSFVFLGSGTFQFIEYSNGDSTIWGGDITVAPMAEGSDYNMGTGTASEDGAAIEPLEANTLHHVVIDKQSGTMYLAPVKQWEIIGPAQELGWNAGTEIALVSSDATGTTFSTEGITLRGPNEYKYRYNSNWDLAFDDIEGFNIFTNFGLSDGNLLIGGSNFNFEEEDGVYTVSATFSPTEIAFNQERTGDVGAVTFDPENFKWGVIGNATAGAWDSDRDLFYKGVSEEKGHWWAGVVYIIADDGEGDAEAFKIRANDDWTVNLGGTISETAGELTSGGDNFAAPAESGAYYIEVYTTDEGTTWNGSIVASSWGVIGDGSPQGNWDADVDMTANGFAEGVTTYTITGDFTTAEWKFRANDDWVINLGGDLTALSLDGDNIALSDGGSKTVTLSVGLADDGTTLYSATVQ